MADLQYGQAGGMNRIQELGLKLVWDMDWENMSWAKGRSGSQEDTLSKPSEGRSRPIWGGLGPFGNVPNGRDRPGEPE